MAITDIFFYAEIGAGAIALILGYVTVRRMRKHSKTHKPHVMNKINDFYKTQNNSHNN